MSAAKSWWVPEDAREIPSPALLIFPERVERNIRRMIQIAGGAGRLRTHVKTHKMPELIRLQLQTGIRKFKCATIAEAEMTAVAGGEDILLAYPLVGPNCSRIVRLAERFPHVKWGVTIDSEEGLKELCAALPASQKLVAYLDVDCGMHRTGIRPDTGAATLYQKISQSGKFKAGGFHVYDGHINQPSLEERRQARREAFAPVETLRDDLEKSGFPVPVIIAGGTPTFGLHAAESQSELAPGTPLLWDFGYHDKYPDLPFEWAALVLSRVVSTQRDGTVCLDLGYKGIAAENPPPRVRFLNVPDAEPDGQSEEHLVIKTKEPLRIGDVVFGVPRHVCPTVALYSEGWFVRPGKKSIPVPVTARNRTLTV